MASQQQVNFQVERLSIQDEYEFVKENYIKWYMIRAQHRKTATQKILVRVKTDTFENDQQRQNFCNVLKFQMNNHKHKGMAVFERIIWDTNGLDIYLVQKFNTYGLMKNLIESAYEKDRPFKEEFVKQWLACLATAVYLLHEEQVCHANIHVLNLYMEKDLLYLGPSERFIRLIEDPKSFTGRGDFWHWKTQDLDDLERSNYAPPEILAGKKSTAPNDIWCLGVSIHFMASCCYPFQGSTPSSVEDKILRRPPNFVNFEKLSPELKDLLSRCLDKNPTTRITASQLIELPYIKPLVDKILGR